MKTTIHIGCPKTGTTTLQRHLFRELPRTHYLGHYSRLNPKLHKLPHKPEQAEEITSKWREAVAKAPKDAELLLYSQEKLTYYPASLAPQVARAIRELVGEARVLITIRRQQDVSVSNYFNLAAKGYPYNFDTFMEQGLQTLDAPATMELREQKESIWGLWLYDRLFRAWEEEFGEVHVVPLEAWKVQPREAEAALAKALGRAPGDVELPSARTRSRASNVPWRRALPRPVEQMIKRMPLPGWLTRSWEEELQVELTDAQRATLEEVYGAANRWLAERTGWDLQALGYPGWGTLTAPRSG